MLFEITHDIFGSVEEFDETNAPDWLTSVNNVKGSTMDYRWFWEMVLKLKIGETIQTDFTSIERVE